MKYSKKINFQKNTSNENLFRCQTKSCEPLARVELATLGLKVPRSDH